MKTEFKLNQNINIHGTSFHNTTITIEPGVLIETFGASEGDDYKCAHEWSFLGQDGKPYTLYDYKQTSLYDSRLPDPLSPIYLNSKIEFHIGSRGDKEMEEKLVEFIKQKIVEKN